MSTALITGASAGLGAALATEFTRNGWQVILTARGESALRALATSLGDPATAVPGDVTEPKHHAALRAAVEQAGGLDALILNASTLGTSPLPCIEDLTPATMQHIWSTNVSGPIALTQTLLPELRRRNGTVISLSSDAAVEHYPTWGGYGSSKAALDHLTLTLGAEEPQIAAYALDPGDMRTAMHQAAFPREDISDRPEPATVAPAFLALLRQRPENGRYQAAHLIEQELESSR